MAELEGLNSLLSELERLKQKFHTGRPPEVVVGYTQSYALYVHEVPADHTGSGRTGKWKFLTDPTRRLSNDGTLKDMIVAALQRGTRLGPALLRAGMRIQRESQQEVPVDTSALKASAFTAYWYEDEGKARAAFDRSEGIRLAELARRRGERGSER